MFGLARYEFSPRRITHVWGTVGLLLVFTLGNSSRHTHAADTFVDRVAPILEQHCLSCHSGPEPEGGFSLNSREAALGSGFIQPTDSQISRLIEVITPVDGHAEMPQDAPPLSEQEIAILTTWIEAGADWPAGIQLASSRAKDFDWWSFQPLHQPSIPELDDEWALTPIDHFILAKLREQGLSPSPVADRRTLIRRLHYDLIGLPPSPEQVEAFARDGDPQAYERLVDRLLASPQYGERWARHWLDVVKYADTHGYDKDKLRPNAWPYRDYVIRSLNADKPYGQFVQEQIAGDVLFPNQPDGIVALGFLAAGPWDFIGHVEVPETKVDGKVARNLDRDDMLSNVMNTFCSLTVQCARCHHHKFDPISQQDYYGMQALIAAVDRADRPYDPDPAAHRARLVAAARVYDLEQSAKALESERERLGGPLLKQAQREIVELEQQAVETKPDEFGYHSQLAPVADQAKWIEITLSEPRALTRIVLHPCHDTFAGIGSGFGFPVRFQVQVSGPAGDAGSSEPAWKMVFEHTRSDFQNPGIRPVEVPVPPDIGPVTRIRLTATKLAERKQDFMLALAELEALDASEDNVAAGADVQALDSIEAPARWQKQNLTDDLWPGKTIERFADRLRTATANVQRIEARIETPQWKAQRSRLADELQAARSDLAALPQPKLVYAATTHFKPQGNFRPTEGKPRTVNMLHRGNVDQPLDAASPRWLPLQPGEVTDLPASASEGERRARLAQWLAANEHPLVWRSIANRIWQYHFGRGIVDSPNDFGRMGELPTHPELLDWLAVQIRDHGQSLKALHRQIVTSRVYQQASEEDTARSRIDSSNRYYWRGPRRKLSAEETRDSILTVSGVMQLAMGGPGFYLFALEKTEHSPHYEYHLFDPADSSSYRRSIYRFVVRSQPDPWMTTLDCADSSQSTPKRSETLTALQALALMNSDFTLEMARRFSARLEQATPTLPAQVDLAGQLLLQRAWDASERDTLVRYGQQHGLENLCRFLFNLSEFAFLD